MSIELIIGIIALIVGVATLIVSYLTYRHARKADKKRKIEEIARKEALLQNMKNDFFMKGLDHTVADKVRIDKSLLETEIEILKSQI
jgi:hypothetical protein